MTYKRFKPRKDRLWLMRVLRVRHSTRWAKQHQAVYILRNPCGGISRRRTCHELHDIRTRVAARRGLPAQYGMSLA